ncbi:MAG: MTAP family purine nucleoside phosphorylase, partial [Candidatus Eremiobacterota bacterium]
MRTQEPIGVVGDLGLPSVFSNPEVIKVETPYGPPSARIEVGELGGRRIAYLSRHGRDQEYIPAHIPYRANLWALNKLGAHRVVGLCAASGLSHQPLGSLVVCDQFVDRTWGRQDTFYEGPISTHVSAFEPYCSEVRAAACAAARAVSIPVQESGTMVVVQGPRLPSRAERDYFRCHKWDVVTMTGYPEAILARELEMCYASLCFVVAHEGETPPDAVHRALEEYSAKALTLLADLVE